MVLNKDQDATNMRMEMFLKALILKMKKEVMENTILLKEEFFKLNLILYLPRYQRQFFQMVQFTQENRKMGVVKVQER